MGKFRCFYITRCLFSILHPWSKILTRGYFLHLDKFSMLLKYIRFLKGTKTLFFSRLFTLLYVRVMFQSVMTAIAAYYIFIYQLNMIFTRGFSPRSCETINACWPASLVTQTHEMIKRPCFKTRLTSDLMPTHLGYFRTLSGTTHGVSQLPHQHDTMATARQHHGNLGSSTGGFPTGGITEETE